MESGNYFDNHTYIYNIMTSTEETCPVCFESYGLHEDGSFLCKDGVSNSGLEGYTCQHYLCIKCWDRMYQREIYNCPLCGENLKIWMITHIGHGEREQGDAGHDAGHDDEYDQAAAEDAEEQHRIEQDQSERNQSEQEYREEQRRELRRERTLFRIGRRRRH